MDLKAQITGLSPNAKKTLGLLVEGFAVRHNIHGFKRGASVPDKGVISLKDGNSLNISAASVREIREALPSMTETYEHNLAEGWKTILCSQYRAEVGRVLDDLARPDDAPVPEQEGSEITLVASHAGDPSVGINGETAEIKLNTGGFGHDDRVEYIEHAKEVLTEAFAKLWDFPVRVQTTEEINAEASPVAKRSGPGL